MAPRADRRAAALCLALLAPAAEADERSASVVLRWQPVADAAAYEIEVARDPDFAHRVVVERTASPGYRWRTLPDARHYWRVRSVDSGGRAGPWSEVKTIEAVLVAPALLEPADLARFTWDHDGTTATFAGAPLEVLREYRLEVAADAGFEKPLLARKGPSPSFQVGLPGVGVFHWRLGGVGLDGRAAPWSRARTFTVDLGAPRLLAPDPNAAVPFGPVAVSWETLAPAARWRVAFGREGEEPRQLEASAPPLRLAPDRPGRHLVRVAAILPDGRAGPESKPRGFVVRPPPPLRAPRLSAPAAGDTLDPARPVAFTWEPVPGAASHELQVAPPGALERARPRPAAGGSLELEDLPQGPLAWRARARDAFGGAGAWSEVWALRLGWGPAVRIEVAVADAALVADGSDSTRLTIRLLDGEGRAVRGSPPPTIQVSAGRVEGPSPAGDGFEVRYVAPQSLPAGGAAEIDVRERDLAARTRIQLSPKVDRLTLAALAGWHTDLKAVSSPSLGVEAAWRTSLLENRLLLSLRVSYWAESATVPPVPGLAARVTATARVVPLSLSAIYEWPLGWATVHAGAGLGADLAFISLEPASQLAATPAALLLAGASGRLGTGEALLELSASTGSVENSLASLRTGGLSISLGYRLRP
ncbi:MAG TPA: hypothetical protein VFR85_05345 [Anaeromyxobacteraceae bacterium]|nr:hypothetical protein [Anaeromyxobacteraceae bacterium]